MKNIAGSNSWLAPEYRCWYLYVVVLRALHLFQIFGRGNSYHTGNLAFANPPARQRHLAA
jgi:hypothetical protein